MRAVVRTRTRLLGGCGHHQHDGDLRNILGHVWRHGRPDLARRLLACRFGGDGRHQHRDSGRLLPDLEDSLGSARAVLAPAWSPKRSLLPMIGLQPLSYLFKHHFGRPASDGVDANVAV